MRKDIVAPTVGESITEVSILKWNKAHGQAVKSGDLLLEIESDKATVEIVAEAAGTLQIEKPVGTRVKIGEKIGFIDDTIAATASAAPAAATAKPATTASSAPAPAATMSAAPAATQSISHSGGSHPSLSPSVRRASAAMGVNPATVAGTGKDGRVTKGDLIGATPSGTGATSAGTPSYVAPAASPSPTPTASTFKAATAADKAGDRRVPMSMLRQKIAERLVQAQHTAAILTTFNEVDMTAVMKIRAEHKDAFKAKHGVNLSFMSFFTKASIAALKAVPEVNASIDGKDTIYHDYYDLGIAVGTERGLVVPVVRGADQMSFVDIEKKIGELAIKARDGKLSMADLTGGTFTISNGGTYGSLMSTPILNPPQSGILGMHKIMDRPMAVNGKVEIRPMMYTALSYDHRIIDGKGAVTWLVSLKEHLENPEKLGFTY